MGLTCVMFGATGQEAGASLFSAESRQDSQNAGPKGQLGQIWPAFSHDILGIPSRCGVQKLSTTPNIYVRTRPLAPLGDRLTVGPQTLTLVV